MERRVGERQPDLVAGDEMVLPAMTASIF